MKPNANQVDARTEQGRQLARRLYDRRIDQLENLSPAERRELLIEFPLLGVEEFQDVVRQVIEAKHYSRERIGWQALPHDITVLVFILTTALSDLRTGIVVAIAVLVLLESLFQFYFERRLYRPLSTLVWLTYPAYAVLVYVLYQRGYEFLLALAIAIVTWGGTFLLGAIARLPVRLILEAREKGAQEARRLRKEPPRKK